MTQKSPLLVMIRPAMQSSQTVQALTQRMGRMPCVIVNPLMTIQDLNVVLPQNLPTPFIFTSQNAVSIAARKTKQRGDVLCVGRKVGQVAQDVGFNVAAVFETADQMLENGLPQSCTYLRGEQVSVDLSSQKVAQVTEYILYCQMPLVLEENTKTAMAEGCIVPIYSENSAIRLRDCLGEQVEGVIAVCISEKAAAPLLNLGLDDVIVVPEPTSAAMIDAVSVRL